MNPVEVGTNTDSAREKVRTELQKAQDELDKITDPAAKELKRAELAAQFWRVNKTRLDLETDKELVSGEDGILSAIEKAFGQLPSDNEDEAKRVANKMTQNIEAQVLFPDTTSEIGKLVFKQINEYNRGPKTMVLLYPIVNKILKKGDPYLTFNPQPGEQQSEFEHDLRYAIRYDATAYKILVGALDRAIRDPSHGERNRTQLGIPPNKDIQVKLLEISQEEKIVADTHTQKEVKKRDRHGDQELRALLEYFDIMGQEEYKRLAMTLYSEEDFVKYVNELYKGGIGTHEAKRKYDETGRSGVQGGMIEKAIEEFQELHPGVDLQHPTPEQESEIENLAKKFFSEELNDRMRRMIGELHRSIDEKDFKTTWQESAQGGNPFYNLNSIMKSLENRINRLKYINVEQLEMENPEFYIQDQKDKTIIVEMSSKFNAETDKTIQVIKDGKAVKMIERHLKIPVNVWNKIHMSADPQKNWGEFITTVQNSIKTELSIRRFLHDARALPFLTVGHEESYLQMLQKFAASETDATLFDSVHTLYGARDIAATADLSSKMRELAFAREDWMFKPLLVDYDLNTGRNQIDDDTWAQLHILLPGKSDAEINRIFSAGVGSNFGLDLSGITGPSQADPSMKENGTPNFGSFGERDTALYSGFNIMTMGHHRWSSERATMYGLLYLPLESAHIKDYFNHWDFNKLIKEQQKFVNSFIAGKDQTDIDEKTLRLVDLFNIGRGGSIYDRGGWRTLLSYEGWLVQDGPSKMDILKSFKAIENIGIEPLKDFINNIESSSSVKPYDANFYKLAKRDGTEETDQIRAEQTAKRRELFDYVYRKYYVAPEIELTEDQIQEEMDKLFKELEEEKADISEHGDKDAAPIKSRSSNYKKFFYGALTRAMVQRMPTKFLRTEMERTRKVSGLRQRSWNAVLDMAKNEQEITMGGVTYHHSIGNEESQSIKNTWESPNKESEIYFTALQDVVAAEVLLRKTTSAFMRKEVDRNQGSMHEVNVGDSYNLTPERLMKLWEDGNIKLDPDENRDRARKLNALAVLKATRKYLYTMNVPANSSGKEIKFIDEFAGKFEGGLPHGPGFALATEELAKEFIVHRAAGENMPRRAFGDNVRLEQGVVKEMDAFFTDLYETGISHSHSFEKLVKHIKTVRDTLDDVHGQELGHTVALWMATTAISLYKLNSKDEWLLGGALTPYHSSLMSFIAGGHTEHIWEWDRVTIREFMESLILVRALPREPYSAQSAPRYEQLYEVDKDGKLVLDDYKNPIEAKDKNGKPKKKREEDFHHYAEQLAENFLQNPLREVSIRAAVIAPVLFILMIAAMIKQAYASVSGKK